MISKPLPKNSVSGTVSAVATTAQSFLRDAEISAYREEKAIVEVMSTYLTIMMTFAERDCVCVCLCLSVTD